jgi:hypothetical protein
MIRMEKDTNNREFMPYQIQNFQYDAETDDWMIMTVGSYNPYAAAIWQWYGQGILFNDGTTTPPSDTVAPDTTCGYLDEDI